MKKRLSIRELCKEIREIYIAKNKKESHEIRRLIYQFTEAFQAEKVRKENISLVLELALEVANSKNPLKVRTEKSLLSYLTFLPIHLFEEKESESLSKIDNTTTQGIVVQLLINFAKELLTIKIPRESFSGKRKGYAIDLLGSLAQHFDFPEFMEIAKQALREKSENQFSNTLETLKEYYESQKMAPDEEVIQLVEKRFEKAKKRSVASDCVSFLIATKAISDLAIFDKMDDWKEKNDVW